MSVFFVARTWVTTSTDCQSENAPGTVGRFSDRVESSCVQDR